MPCLARPLLQCCRCRSKLRHSKSGPFQILMQSACLLVVDCWAILLFHARCKASPRNSTPNTFSHVVHKQLCLQQVSQPRMLAPKVCAHMCFRTTSGQVSILQSLRLPCRANFPLVKIRWPLQASPGQISPGFACQLSRLWRHRHRPRGRSEQAEPTSAYRRKPERQRQRRSSKQVEKS